MHLAGREKGVPPVADTVAGHHAGLSCSIHALTCSLGARAGDDIAEVLLVSERQERDRAPINSSRA
jgi:hypothetical protein